MNTSEEEREKNRLLEVKDYMHSSMLVNLGAGNYMTFK